MGKSKRKQITKKNKTTKNKKPLKNCERFCEKDYRPEMNKIWKRNLETVNEKYKKPSKSEKKWNLKDCKRRFWDETCKGFTYFGEKQRSIDEFARERKNGFHKKYKKDQVEMLKKRGALSACFYDSDYNAFHK